MLSLRVPRMVPLNTIEQEPKFQKTSSSVFRKFYPSLRRPLLEGRLHTPGPSLEKPPTSTRRQPIWHAKTVPPWSLEHPMGPSLPTRVARIVPLDTLERLFKFPL